VAKTNQEIYVDARKKKIALFDDREDNRAIMRKLFEREFHFAEYSDGASALDDLSSDPPDLLLLDICMPGMNGFEVLRKLRADRRFEKLIVVAFTGAATPEDASLYERAGFDYLICKPVNPLAVMNEVRALLQVRAVMEGLSVRFLQRVAHC
jgi:putative two-component system response regulator